MDDVVHISMTRDQLGAYHNALRCAIDHAEHARGILSKMDFLAALVELSDAAMVVICQFDRVPEAEWDPGVRERQSKAQARKTVLALAAAAGLSADEEECREVQRVLNKPVSEFTARNGEEVTKVGTPSEIDRRRLRDAAQALEVSTVLGETAAEVLEQLGIVHDGLAALQSLDDLGPEANAKADLDERELWKRMATLEEHLKVVLTKECGEKPR